MIENIESIVRKSTGASEAHEVEELQRLWSGYGSIVRYALKGASVPSVIVKHVSPPRAGMHPRGWNTDRSHQRKLYSYAVETNWYQSFAATCGSASRVPRYLGGERDGDEVVIVLEDLDAAGYPRRTTFVTDGELAACLSWLANFHASFLGSEGVGLWQSGTYWHLETRPDELDVLKSEDPELHAASAAIDARLKGSPFQTLVHGDAKLANFCFSQEGDSVAAVDFQYVGRGCGMKDLAYFIGSCLDEESCAASEAQLLDYYFEKLREAVRVQQPELDADALESDWRGLYPVAWTDFHRFLKGWSPGHWKVHGYSEALARSVIASIKEEAS
ncbi:MAG: phosphotransferase [Coraliomargarita sp.]|nr:phosphotransferase [Coraliomargarita sp.]